MKFKKIMLLAIFLVSLLAVSAVSAADNATDDVVSVKKTTDEVVGVKENQVIDYTGIDDATGAEDNGTFTALQKKINDAVEDSTVTLENDYAYDEGFGSDGITIYKSLTIDGNGHALDGLSESKIFLIKEGHVVFKNIEFRNGYKTDFYDGDGGAIHVWSGSISVFNCSFINNTAKWGGAIYCYDADVVNCSFKNNSAETGGAIYHNLGILSVDGCTFTSNKCDDCDGDAQSYYGGAIFASADLYVENSRFEDNKGGESYRGAIYFDSYEKSVEKIYDYFGNVIETKTIVTYKNCSVSNSTFINNRDSSGGGAIYSDEYLWGTGAKAYGCTFINNSVNVIMHGGAVNCIFINNLGSALYEADAVNCTFINNSADFGGAIYGGDAVNCTFINNSAIWGGAIADCSKVADCIFISNFAEYGGAVYSERDVLSIMNSIFANNTSSDGLVIRSSGKTYYSNITINGIKYASLFEDMAEFHLNHTLILNEYLDVDNAILDGKGNCIAGKYPIEIAVAGNNVTLKNILFKNVKIKSKVYNFNVINCMFIDNATMSAYEDNCTIMNCIFANNTSNEQTVYFGGKNGNIVNSIFENNVFDGEGCAVYFDKGNCTIMNCIFTNNTSDEGAVYIWRDDCTIMNSIFLHNNAKRGGAIYNYRDDCTIIDSTFAYNAASDGNAIYNNGKNCTAANCKFTDSSELEAGKETKFINCTFGYVPEIPNGTDETKLTPEITAPILDNSSGNGSAEVKLPLDATGSVTLTVNGKEYVFDVCEGKANVKLPDLSNGDYPYTITYSGDSKYSSFTNHGSLKVNKTIVNPIDNKTDTDENNTSQENTTVVDNSKIVASNVKVTYATGSYYTIKVYGTDGKPANGVNVKIMGKISKSLTTTNGIAKFKITQVPGTYKITINALGKKTTKTLTVKHIVTLKTVTLKKSAKKLTLQATLAKVNGKYLKKKTITFKINGKKVATAKTNSKGVAKITIKNPNVVKKLKVGKKVTYQATYLKDTVKKTTKVKK